MGRRGGFVSGIMWGALAGVVGGILFAPKKGSETRKELKEKVDVYGKKYGEKIKDVVNDVREGGEKLKGDVEKLGQDLSVETQRKVTELFKPQIDGRDTVATEPRSSVSDDESSKRRYFKGT